MKQTKIWLPRSFLTIHYLLFTLFLFALVVDLSAQSGGTFEIQQSVIANGGGSLSGGTFSLAGTSGQAVTTNSSGSPYSLRSGFWKGELGPSAAMVTLSGRVATADGRGIRNVRVSLTDQTGNVRNTLTSAFGYYRFDDIEAGQNVVISIAAKRYAFANPTRILSVQDGLVDIDFIAEQQ